MPKLSRRGLFIVLVVLLLASISPSIVRTYSFAKTPSGLITLASLPKAPHQRNPWYWDSYLISPNMAEWLLGSLTWSFEDATLWGMPVLQQAIAAHSSAVMDELGHDSDDVARLERIMHLLSEGGAPVNRYWEHNTPLLTAILFCDSGAVRILLESGADPNLPVKRDGHSTDGMSALEFSKWLDEPARRDNIPRPEGCRENIAGLLLAAKDGLGE